MIKPREAVTLNPVEAFGYGKNGGRPFKLHEATRALGIDLIASRRQARPGKTQKTILMIDERQLTLECFTSWLGTRITDMSVEAYASASEVARRADLNATDVALLLLNIGARHISDPKSADELNMIQEILPNVPVVIISDHQETRQIVDALECGVRGYIPTSTEMAVVVGAIRLVQSGGVFVPASAFTAMGRERGSRLSISEIAADSASKDFTNRQKQVLACLQEGKPNKLIAHELEMCESTVKVHVRHIMKKLGATNRTQVAYLTKSLFDAK